MKDGVNILFQLQQSRKDTKSIGSISLHVNALKTYITHPLENTTAEVNKFCVIGMKSENNAFILNVPVNYSCRVAIHNGFYKLK